MNAFVSADILLPAVDELHCWAVIACDQFTSDPAYWCRVREHAGNAPSAVHLILPEAELDCDRAIAAAHINQTMVQYLASGIFREYPCSYIYVERTLQNGSVRPGLIGMVDLEQYDYHPGSSSLIRATEQTVLERIPPRQEIRKDASLEFPHVLMLCDDAGCELLEPIGAHKDQLTKLYDFELMEDGGHITGWLLSDEERNAFDCRFGAYSAQLTKKYPDLEGPKVLLAVGDGNHSLATAKSCYEYLKAANPDLDFSCHPARYALVELENIHDPSLSFEPIHRIITKTDPESLLHFLSAYEDPDGFPIPYITADREGTLYLTRKLGELAVAVLQGLLDQFLARHEGDIDYIHGEEELERLATQPGAIGFCLPTMEKNQLFRGVIAGGVLPRKTFSMGHAREKRYYLEGRRIR